MLKDTEPSAAEGETCQSNSTNWKPPGPNITPDCGVEIVPSPIGRVDVIEIA
jgi:hypothetical protein